jgi:hypothetical protein
MAISSSSTFLYIPGQDSNQQLQMNAALNTNSNILSILTSSASAQGVATSITNLAAVQAQASLLPQVEPLPTFANFSNYNNTPGYTIYDNDMQPIDGGALTTNSEIGQGYTGQNYTSSNFGSSGVTSYWVNATPFHQAEGNWLVTIPGMVSAGNNAPYGKQQDGLASAYARFGVMIGASGIKQKWSLYTSDSNVYIYPFGGNAPYEGYSINNSSLSSWYGGNGYGSIGYNDRTRTLVMLEGKDNSNNYRMHIWRNTNANRSLYDTNLPTGVLYNFMAEAKSAGTPSSTASGVYYTYNDFQWQTTNSTSYTESRYRMTVIPCDNGQVGLSRFTPSTEMRYGYFAPVVTIAGTAGTMTTLNAQSTTTSYGIDQGSQYGHRHVQTWDNQWVAAYSPYYYYGCGLIGIISNTANPAYYYTVQYQGTSNGGQLAPFKQDKFLFNTADQNSDGNVGSRFWINDVGGWYLNGKDWAQNTIANGASMSLTNPPTQLYMFDTRYTSTNYPGLISPEHWTNG